MAETKEKIGSIRRFGARYGRTPRLRFGKIEQEQRKHHKCPYCMNVTVKRLSAGIWECKKCGNFDVIGGKDELKENAKDFKHLTAKQAAEIAKKAKVKKLVLTHFSQRYKDTKGMKKEAETIFKNVVCANDFDFFKV